ncbi:DUF927 domain-containing protein [uncultured Thiodictyon sp.]|uniref:DUF927 domain-containing protein n=2 Tax=uncultured Thiodictyon sp. TaxID=1846217 RepID=UPI0025F0575C|nr:DUF927 domain-containing protein [uncultured Thiodictyon sp.]
MRPTTAGKLGEPSATWEYRDADGRPVAYVLRFDRPEGGKEFRPQTWDGTRWNWKAPAVPRPLYHLDLLAARPDAPVLVCEGEKAADAAAVLMPDWVTCTTSNGSQSPGKSDLSPLAGRHVRIWPDHDEPGATYARTVRELALAAGAVSVDVLDLASLAVDPGTGEPHELPKGWDAADAVDDSWSAELVEAEARWIGDPETGPAASLDDIIPDDQEANPAKIVAPAGWSLTKSKVFQVKEKDKDNEYIPICGALWIIGRTTGPHGDWGLMLAFKDHDKQERRAAIPASRLHEDATALARELATQGLRVVPGKEKRMLEYLDAWEVDNRILSAKRLGWLEDKTGALSFVMPDRVIARDGTKEVVFQPERFSPTIKTVHSCGSIAEWNTHVAASVCEHPAMLFALCAGLAPAFLAFAEAADSFIIHFWGKTSRGKTTLGQVAASPWGCAADPNDAPSLTFVRRWNLTGNGLEGLAEAHSDMPLVLDELGAHTGGDIRPLIYQLSGGQGKTALNSAREMKEPRAWRTIAISTGELSIHARMSDPDGDGIHTRTVKGGLTHRALDVELTDIAKGAPEADREAVVSGIKTACARYYGTAGPELIRVMIERFGSAAEVRAYARDQVKAIMPTLTNEALPIETARAVRRFALICLAGEFAADHGLIPTTAENVREATRAVVSTWLVAGAETDDLRIIASVRGFIQKHEARFQPTLEPEPVPNRAGWRSKAEDLWMFTDAGLTEAAPGNDKTAVARVLRAAGYLFCNDDAKTGSLKARLSTGGAEGRQRLYAVRGDILDEKKAGCLSKTPGQPGQPGQTRAVAGSEPVQVDEMQPGQPGQDTWTGQEKPPVYSGCVQAVQVGHRAPGQAQTRVVASSVQGVQGVQAKNRDSQLFETETAYAEVDL